MRCIPLDPFNNPETPDIMPVSFLQTPFWAEFKAVHGWRPLYFRVQGEMPGTGSYSFFLSVLVRSFSSFASIAYVPMGPVISLTEPEEQAHFLFELTQAITVYLPPNTLCVRFDPPWNTEFCNSNKQIIKNAGRNIRLPLSPSIPIRRAPSDVQPPDTVILDLKKRPEVLLEEMKPKWRYNIRLGERKGVTVRYLEGKAGAEEGVALFYQLYLETAKRDGIAIHSKEYYRDLVCRASNIETHSVFDKKTVIRVYIAEYEGTVLASIITLFCGEDAIYLYGASSNEKRNLMPAYSLQWRAIRDAQNMGCLRYDFYGIPPSDDPSHPMYGLYRFKTGFGGCIVHRVGSLDIPIHLVAYKLYRIAESLRTLWFKRVVKLFKQATQQKS